MKRERNIVIMKVEGRIEEVKSEVEFLGIFCEGVGVILKVFV